MAPRKKTEAEKKPTPSEPKTRRKRGAGGAPGPQTETSFPVVGIGASAGGLAAFEAFFTHMPADSGMAFVLVQHLDPTHKSILSNLIGQYTAMPVAEVEDGIEVQPGHVYTIPPNRDLAILNGRLQLLEPTAARGRRTPIDFFFRSLAQDRKEQAIGIVLSGTGTEGTLGVRAIKEAGGLVVVQDATSAEYDSMPRSAAATGLADFVLPPEQMPERLLAYVRHPRGALAVPEPLDQLQKVCVLLRGHTGHDFSQYKPNTLLRRVSRRMALHELDTMEDYVRYLRETPLELGMLFKELLIVVTRFFREPEAFAAVAEKALPSLLESRGPNQAVRVWVPACATGEEAYSIAILLREWMEKSQREFPVEIFATDLDADAIELARRGVYPQAIAADVSAERLRRFFSPEDQSYGIRKSIRDWLVFAEQSLVKDPPFSNLDLISCRNLLIYMEGDLQKKVLPLFHYSLKPGGYLLLGNSESIGEATDLFEPVDRKWKLFRRRETRLARGPLEFFPPVTAVAGSRRTKEGTTALRVSCRELAERSLLAHFDAAGILIDAQGEVLYIHGRTGQYLEPAEGEARWHVLSMAREGLRLALSAAVRQAQARQEEVRRERVRIQVNGDAVFVDLAVRPVREPAAQHGLLMVVLEPVPGPEAGSGQAPAAVPEGQVVGTTDLERELQSAREYLQITVEELETANEELRSSNEELQSTNEELQSTNEELETSREEQQSVNEELATVNAELQSKVEQLSRTRNDMQNLLASTEVGTVFLDLELHIQRFTPAATRLINLIDTDVGRPIHHIVTNLNYPALVEDARRVLDTLVPGECEVQARDGAWYVVRIGPYRTVENVIDGLVITFVDVSEQKAVQQELRQANLYAQAVVDTVWEPLLVLDADLRVRSANQSFYRIFAATPQETEGQLIHDLDNQQWNIPALRQLLEKVLPGGTPFSDYEVEHDFPRIGRRRMRLNARRIEATDGGAPRILLAMADVSERP